MSEKEIKKEKEPSQRELLIDLRKSFVGDPHKFSDDVLLEFLDHLIFVAESKYIGYKERDSLRRLLSTNIQKRIYSVLGIRYQTIDDIRRSIGDSSLSNEKIRWYITLMVKNGLVERKRMTIKGKKIVMFRLGEAELGTKDDEED